MLLLLLNPSDPLGISVTGDAISGYEITVTGMTGYYRFRVIRTDQSGHYPVVTVRDFDMISPTGSTMIQTDYEAPFNTTVVYTVQAYLIDDLDMPIAAADSDPQLTTLPEEFAIISDPLDASQRIAVGISDLSEWNVQTPILGDHRVLGRRNSVINTDVESGREGEIAVTNLTVWDVDWDGSGPYDIYEPIVHANWATMFAPGRTLLFRNDWTESNFDDCYMKALARATKRLTSVGRNDGNPFMSYQIQFKEQDRPSTGQIGLGIQSWKTVNDSNADWQEVNDDHADWLSVATDPDL